MNGQFSHVYDIDPAEINTTLTIAIRYETEARTKAAELRKKKSVVNLLKKNRSKNYTPKTID